MRPAVLTIILVLLSSCDTPSGRFAGADAVTVQIEASVFDVRRVENEAEAIRTNSEYAPNLASVAPRAVMAIEQATGCNVVPGSISGDQALIRAELDCS